MMFNFAVKAIILKTVSPALIMTMKSRQVCKLACIAFRNFNSLKYEVSNVCFNSETQERDLSEKHLGQTTSKKLQFLFHSGKKRSTLNDF